ncbi:MAG: pyruvate ferredoxin oxidoreductase [Prevotella sp.]|nr:pyruvate ferredoxin oxidoreductase [Prevotella sp.]
MDYKYIEQLLERYWECQTTLEEEAILRAFFAQDNVPVELLQYRQIFIAQSEEQKQVRISDDFESRILAVINDEKPVKARTITLSQRLRPLYRAAAVVAVIVTLGTAAQKATEPTDSPYPSQMAKEPAVSNGPSVAVKDSVKSDTIKFGKQHSQLNDMPETIIK